MLRATRNNGCLNILLIEYLMITRFIIFVIVENINALNCRWVEILLNVLQLNFNIFKISGS